MNALLHESNVYINENLILPKSCGLLLFMSSPMEVIEANKEYFKEQDFASGFLCLSTSIYEPMAHGNVG